MAGKRYIYVWTQHSATCRTRHSCGCARYLWALSSLVHTAVCCAGASRHRRLRAPAAGTRSGPRQRCVMSRRPLPARSHLAARGAARLRLGRAPGGPKLCCHKDVVCLEGEEVLRQSEGGWSRERPARCEHGMLGQARGEGQPARARTANARAGKRVRRLERQGGMPSVHTACTAGTLQAQHAQHAPPAPCSSPSA